VPVLLVLIPVAWLLLCLLAVGLCSAAKQGDQAGEPPLAAPLPGVLRPPIRSRGDGRACRRPAAPA
jgi:hypothetical protein